MGAGSLGPDFSLRIKLLVSKKCNTWTAGLHTFAVSHMVSKDESELHIKYKF